MRGYLTHRYLIALGSNQRHTRFGSPRRVLDQACAALGDAGKVEAISPMIDTAPLGSARRRYANAAAILTTDLDPEAMLDALQAIERRLGRVRRGRRWRARVIDLDLVLWSGGPWSSPRLTIPHRECRRRRFVLDPAAEIAPGWRDPITGLRIAHLRARLTRPSPLP